MADPSDTAVSRDAEKEKITSDPADAASAAAVNHIDEDKDVDETEKNVSPGGDNKAQASDDKGQVNGEVSRQYISSINSEDVVDLEVQNFWIYSVPEGVSHSVWAMRWSWMWCTFTDFFYFIFLFKKWYR